MKKLHRAWFRALAFCLAAAASQGTALAQGAPGGTPGTVPPVQPPSGQTPVPQPPATQPAPGQPRPQPAPPGAKPAPPTQAAAPALPSGYVIGPDDVLTITYWRNPDMSAEVTVRPDGLISLPLLNEIKAGGQTPEQLREKVSKDAMRFLEEAPTVAVVVKAINSRKVYVTGMVAKPGYYQLTGAMTVVQLLATAGGIQEFADSKNILIVRNEAGRQVSYPFNYKDFLKRKNLTQNIELKPGDTIVVP